MPIVTRSRARRVHFTPKPTPKRKAIGSAQRKPPKTPKKSKLSRGRLPHSLEESPSGQGHHHTSLPLTGSPVDFDEVPPGASPSPTSLVLHKRSRRSGVSLLQRRLSGGPVRGYATEEMKSSPPVVGMNTVSGGDGEVASDLQESEDDGEVAPDLQGSDDDEEVDSDIQGSGNDGEVPSDLKESDDDDEVTSDLKGNGTSALTSHMEMHPTQSSHSRKRKADSGRSSDPTKTHPHKKKKVEQSGAKTGKAKQEPVRHQTPKKGPPKKKSAKKPKAKKLVKKQPARQAKLNKGK